MSEAALFLGGPWDGRRDVEHRLGTRMTIIQPTPIRHPPYPSEGDTLEIPHPSFVEHTYRLMQYRSPSSPIKTLTLWVHSTIEEDAIMERLVHGYSGKAFVE